MNIIVTIIIGFLTILTSSIAIIQTRRFNAYQKKVVKHQGVFREPNIDLKLFAKPANLTFIFSLPLCENSFIEIPTVISLRNNGDKSAEAVELFIRTHKDLVLGGPSLKNGVKSAFDPYYRETNSLLKRSGRIL